MASNKAERDVHIVCVDGEYRVRPAMAAVRGRKVPAVPPAPGPPVGKVSFRNTTKETVVLIFPSKTLTVAEGDVKTLLAGKGKEFDLADLDDLDPIDSSALPKVVSYVVAVFKGSEVILAKGESDPRLIIDP